MVLVALLVGLFIVAIGMFGVAAPHGLLTAVGSILTPFGLYLVAALRIRLWSGPGSSGTVVARP